MITETEELITEPSFQRMNPVLLSQDILANLVDDLTLDTNKHDLYKSTMYLTTLEVSNSFFTAVIDKLFHDGPFIVDGHQKLYGEESVADIIKTLVDQEAAAPIFQEYIIEKNGIIPEVECLRVEFIEATVTKLKE